MSRLARRRGALRIAVPENLLSLSPAGGHGRVWHEVLRRLERSAQIHPLSGRQSRVRRAIRGRTDVVLVDGHADLPAVGVPLVVQVHEAGWFTDELRSTLHPDFHAFIASRTESAVRAADRVIVPSAAAADDLVSLYGLAPERVHAVHHGVDKPFHPGASGGRALVARARRGPEAPYVLYAAALHPRKNLTVLREAMARLAHAGLPHLLVVAGGPAVDRPDSSELERQAAADLTGTEGRVVRIHTPTDAELAGLMGEADAFCLPSLYEGFGMTVLEAMACGAPVVVSDRGALPEVVGDAGLVVPPVADAIAGALREVLTDPGLAAELGRAAGERARSFTWERTAAGWLAVLRAAASAKLDSRRGQDARARLLSHLRRPGP